MYKDSKRTCRTIVFCRRSRRRRRRGLLKLPNKQNEGLFRKSSFRALSLFTYMLDQSINQSIILFSNAGLQSGSHKADVDLQRTNKM